MRFKKGSKVRFSTGGRYPQDRGGALKSSQAMGILIMSGTITIQWIWDLPWKAIRPCPPFVEGLRCWAPGDIVEVFDNKSWKLAEVSRVFRRGYFFVRLLGSSMEFKAHSSDIRTRQSWEDNRWVIIGKDSSKCHNGTRSMLQKEGVFICQELKTCLEENSYARDDHLTVDNFVPRFFSKDAKKRLSAHSLFVETCAGAGKNIRTIKKEGSNHPLVTMNSPDSEKGQSWRL